MPMTLDMPETLDDHAPASAVESAADQAADLLDRPNGTPDAEACDDPNLPFDTNEPTSPQDAADDRPTDANAGAPAEQSPEKKKRGRKKKSTTPSMDVATETSDTPTVADAALAKPSPAMTKDTRQFQIASVQSEYVEVCLRVNCIQAAIESAKDELKSLEKRQAAIASELMQLRNSDEWQRPLFTDPANQPAGTGTAAGNEGPAATTPQVADSDHAAGDARPADAVSVASQPAAVDPDAWKTAPLAELHLSASLSDKLTEAGADTIGRLENLRAEISQGRDKWPKGIGKAKITDIENAVVEWLSKNRDAAVLAEAKQAANGQPVAEINASKPLTFDQWESLTDDQRNDYICARAVLIDDGQANCFATKHPDNSKFWDSGYQAQGEGKKVTDCPYVAGPEMDDWIRGWFARGAVENFEPSKPNPPASHLVSLSDL